MSEQMPSELANWPPKNIVTYGLRVGKKCVVRLPHVEQGQWLEAGGAPPLNMNIQMEDLEATGLTHTGGGGIDTAQARVYYRCADDGQAPEVRVILPDDAPFRACRKGKSDGRSKSYDQEGNPVYQVRLLHALKTGRREDRSNALESIPLEAWPGNFTEFNARIFNLIELYSSSNLDFRTFVGEFLARYASQKKGLDDWCLWENVADDAAAFTRRPKAVANGEMQPNNHDLFVRAVKETTLEHHGLPSQDHVEERWINLGGIGAWKEIRKTLGFEWIPPKPDWDESWSPLIGKNDATSP
jgi:hypothetical protein